jgi:hypothetical protein
MLVGGIRLCMKEVTGLILGADPVYDDGHILWCPSVF